MSDRPFLKYRNYGCRSAEGPVAYAVYTGSIFDQMKRAIQNFLPDAS